jgi:hypothetical protein
MHRRAFLALLAATPAAAHAHAHAHDGWSPLPLHKTADAVSPGSGIVLWTTSEHAATDAITMEYAYLRYGDVIIGKNQYDWTALERILDAAAGRGHQAIVRFYDTYVGKPSGVPDYIRALPDYRETAARSEGKRTAFPDWSHPELRRGVPAFFEAMAARYDRDPRLAILQCGFGLWSEYHIYDGPFRLGGTFPSKADQAAILRTIAGAWKATPWQISVDAADAEVSPIISSPELLALPFGTFDDSFLCEQHARVNERNWDALDRDRWRRAPAGGEFSYYNDRDQREALAPGGPNGEPFERAAARFHLTFLIGNDQPEYRPMERIRAAGRACGYRLAITAYATDGMRTRVTVTNGGIAPPYFDLYVAIAGTRGATSLRGLLPGESRECVVDRAPTSAPPAIVGDRLVPGQTVPYSADLGGGSAPGPGVGGRL